MVEMFAPQRDKKPFYVDQVQHFISDEATTPPSNIIPVKFQQKPVHSYNVN